MPGADKHRCIFGRVIAAAVRLYHDRRNGKENPGLPHDGLKDGNGKLASDSSPVVKLVHPITLPLQMPARTRRLNGLVL